MSISEFERTKPKITLEKINKLISVVSNEKQNVESREHLHFAESVYNLLIDMKSSFLKGE